MAINAMHRVVVWLMNRRFAHGNFEWAPNDFDIFLLFNSFALMTKTTNINKHYTLRWNVDAIFFATTNFTIFFCHEITMNFIHPIECTKCAALSSLNVWWSNANVQMSRSEHIIEIESGRIVIAQMFVRCELTTIITMECKVYRAQFLSLIIICRCWLD